MSDIELVVIVVNRLKEIPPNKRAYELVSAYGLAHRLMQALWDNGVEVMKVDNDKSRHLWLIKVEKGYFPMRCSSNLPPGTFILQPL